MSNRALKLFLDHVCPFCHRAVIVAKEKNVSYTPEIISLKAMPDWYATVNPNKTVPTLAIAEGKYVFESSLIAQYFDNISSNPGSLMGKTPYQRHRIEFFISQVGSMIESLYELLSDPFNEEKRKSAEENIAYVERIIVENQTTGPYYLDETFSMADIAVVPFLLRLKAGLTYFAGFDLFSNAPRLKGIWAAAIQRPSVIESSLKPEEYIQALLPHVSNDAPTFNAGDKLILYGSDICPFVDRVRLACSLKNISVHWVDVPLAEIPSWFKYINPRETVPVLVTPQGEVVHESMLIVQYLDALLPKQGSQLLARKDADKLYATQYAIETVGELTSACYGLIFSSASQEAQTEIERVLSALELQLKAQTFGPGVFFGGKTMNAADIAILPHLVRVEAAVPELTNGYNPLSKYPSIKQLVDAGQASEEGKSIFLSKEVYADIYKRRLGKA